MGRSTVLYRLFDAQGHLLYVGITCGPRERFKAHHGEKAWWPRVVGCTFEHFETRRQALAAESEAIRNEQPVFNVSGRSPALTELVQQAEYARAYIERLPSDGADLYCDVADFLDAFGLYDQYDSSPEARKVIDRILNLLNLAFPTPGARVR